MAYIYMFHWSSVFQKAFLYNVVDLHRLKELPFWAYVVYFIIYACSIQVEPRDISLTLDCCCLSE